MLSRSTAHRTNTCQHILVLTAALTITIPGHAATYKEPTDGPTASIEFVDESPSQKMSLHFHGGAEECTDRINVGGVQANSRRALVVPAGKEFVFTAGMDPNGAGMALLGLGAVGGLMAASNTNTSCTPTIDFVPEAGSAYMFRMTTDGKGCGFKFHLKPSATQSPDDAPPVAFETRQWIRAWGSSGPFCKKK
jgi:hypothetical protein